MLSFKPKEKTIATDLQLQLNCCLCRPPCFPYEKLGWFCVRLVYTSFLYKILVRVSRTRNLDRLSVRLMEYTDGMQPMRLWSVLRDTGSVVVKDHH